MGTAGLGLGVEGVEGMPRLPTRVATLPHIGDNASLSPLCPEPSEFILEMFPHPKPVCISHVRLQLFYHRMNTGGKEVYFNNEKSSSGTR